MHDEPPAPRTTEVPIADSTAEPTDDSTAEPTDDRRERDDRPERGGETPATEPPSPRPRDGVDPPDGEAPIASDDDPDRDGDNPDRDGDEAPLAYRLERLRLWRTLATLAVVVARLIRSL
jgi:hypothetical protein